MFLLLAVDDDAAGTEPGIFPVMEQLVRQVYFATELLLSSSEKKKGLLLIGYMVDLLSICLNQFVMNLGFINNISLT